MKTLIAALSILSAVQAFAAAPQKIDNFALIDHQGKFHELDYYCRMPSAKAIALFVHGNGCPLVQKRIPELKRLQERYESKGILFGMLNANPQDEREDIAKEAAEFGIAVPILKDEAQLVAQMLKLQRTAEMILISTKTKEIVYRGAIDDRLNYQAEKPAATAHYFTEAVDAFLEGKEIAQPATDAPGCKIALPKPQAELTYTGDIAPILKENCVKCHTKGGLAPFAMSSYKKVRGWSEMMADVILAKQMPPWHADPKHGKFANDIALTPEQEQQLVSWVRAGAPRGEGDDPLEGHVVELSEWKLGNPDRVVELPEQKVDPEGVFKYRYVIIDPEFEEDTWVTATEIAPGNTRVLHHVIVTAHHPEVRKFEKWITGYAPGTGAAAYPDGSGIKIPKGWKLRFQLHYTASGKDETDITKLGLHVSEKPLEKEFRTNVIMKRDFKIPPGANEYEAERSVMIGSDSILYSMNPHMHYRGKRMSFEAKYPDGRRETLLSVPNYDFNWQTTYVLKEPLKLPARTEIVIKNAWDNSELNPYNPDPAKEVRWGDQSFEEMFFATLNYVRSE